MTAEDFYGEQSGMGFEAMCQLAQANEPVDELTVSAQLEPPSVLKRVGGSTAVEQLAAGRRPRAPVRAVREHAQLWRSLSATYEIQAPSARP